MSALADMKNLVATARKGLLNALLQVGIYWYKGHWAMATGRGYPITGGWGATTSSLCAWLLYGGDFPHNLPPEHPEYFRFNTQVKGTGLNMAMGIYHNNFTIPRELVMAGAVEKPRRVMSKFASNFQSSYITANYSHYSEAGKLWQQASWRSRIAFMYPYGASNFVFSPITFAVNPSFAYRAVVDPINLKTSRLYGSMTYGTSTQENFLQQDDAVLHVVYFPKNCTYCILGEIIYVPIPGYLDGRNYKWLPPTPSVFNYSLPVLSADKYRLFYGYQNLFVAVISNSAIVAGTQFNITSGYREFALFYNIYGSADGSVINNTESDISIGFAVETSNPWDYPGNTHQDRFNAFVAKYSKIAIPKQIGKDAKTGGPTFSYVNANNVNMTLAWKYNSAGAGAWLDGKYVNYTAWPFMYEEVKINSTYSSVWVNLSVEDSVAGKLPINAVDFKVGSVSKFSALMSTDDDGDASSLGDSNPNDPAINVNGSSDDDDDGSGSNGSTSSSSSSSSDGSTGTTEALNDNAGNTGGSGKGSSASIIAGSTVGAAALIGGDVAAAVFFLRRRKSLNAHAMPVPTVETQETGIDVVESPVSSAVEPHIGKGKRRNTSRKSSSSGHQPI